jgi:hypothetical protein
MVSLLFTHANVSLDIVMIRLGLLLKLVLRAIAEIATFFRSQVTVDECSAASCNMLIDSTSSYSNPDISNTNAVLQGA